MKKGIRVYSDCVKQLTKNPLTSEVLFSVDNKQLCGSVVSVPSEREVVFFNASTIYLADTGSTGSLTNITLIIKAMLEADLLSSRNRTVTSASVMCRLIVKEHNISHFSP